MIGIVFATAMLYYDWTVTMTGTQPLVVFYKWADGTNATTINLSYNIYPDLWLIDNNATYGIKNGNTTAKTVYMWVESCNATAWFANYTVQILNTTGNVQATWTTTDFSSVGETTAVSWSHPNATIYTIKVLFKGSGSVAVGQAATVQMKLKTEG
jgi:hypothetical protein